MNLRKVDLSSNGIHFLPDIDKMKRLSKLESLLLHKNLITGYRELENLIGMEVL